MTAPLSETTWSKPRDARLAFYHPNSAGAGAAVQVEPRVNRVGTERYNCFFLEMALQKSSSGQREGKKTPATFDWDHKLTVKLGFMDLCEMLLVLEGRSDKIGGVRNGLFHQNGASCTIITLQKAEKGGYFLGLSKKSSESGPVVKISLLLNEAEALGLRCIFQSGLFFITFHAHLAMFQPGVPPN